jgi:hypothetical protein
MQNIKVKVLRDLYDQTLTMQQIGSSSLSECIDCVREYCGGIVWQEIETTEQKLPKFAKYVDTFYGINVYFDSVTETFLFEEFN